MKIKLKALKFTNLVLAEKEPSSEFNEIAVDTSEIAAFEPVHRWEELEDKRSYVTLKKDANSAFAHQYYRRDGRYVIDEPFQSLFDRIEKLEKEEAAVKLEMRS